MPTDFVIYHNPKCSKSRAALQLLRANGIEPTVVEYLKTPPDTKMLFELLRTLGLNARNLIRDGEAEYTDLRLSEPSVTDAELIEAIAKHPILLQRPIIVRGDHAVIARPPEKVRELM